MDASDRTIATERIRRLQELAREAVRADPPDPARRDVRPAPPGAARRRPPRPHPVPPLTCDRCDAYLVPGRNARVRTREGHVVVTCDCGEHARYPYD